MAEMTGYGLQKQFYEWLAETDESVTPAIAPETINYIKQILKLN